MPQNKEKARERQRRYREKLHTERYGQDAGDQRGLHTTYAQGPLHQRWNENRLISSHGYAKVRVGKTHPLADPNGYAYEHLVVWVSAGRDRPTQGETLHHVNENKTDNRIENLEKKSRSDHNREHVPGFARDENSGRFRGKDAGCLVDGVEHKHFPLALSEMGEA